MTSIPDLTIPDFIRELEAYVPGKPLKALEREYGISDSIKLASNENPLGPSPKAMAAVGAALADLHRYPEGGGYDLTLTLARHLGLAPGNIVLGNGSDDILGMLARALLQPGDEALMPAPSFLMYDLVVRAVGAKGIAVPLKSLTIDLDEMLRVVSPRCRMIFLCNPNNPTGTVVTADAFERFLQRLPSGILVAVDEAYIEFVRDSRALRALDFLEESRPLVVLRTFSKAYGLAGLRVGYGLMPTAVADLLHRVRMPFNVNTLGQVGATAALEDTEFLSKTLDLVHNGLDLLWSGLDRLGIRYFHSEANFFLIDVQRDAGGVCEALLRRGVIVRSMAAYDFPQYIRVNVGLPDENQRFVQALSAVL